MRFAGEGRALARRLLLTCRRDMSAALFRTKDLRMVAMFKSCGRTISPFGRATLMTLALGLVACGDRTPTTPAVNAPRFPTERVAVMPLPDPDTVVQALIAHTTTPEQGRVPPADAPGLAVALVSPPFHAVLYPPTNASKLSINVVLEPDAWRLREQHSLDGIDVVVRIIGAAGVTDTQHLVIDPGQIPTPSPVSLDVDIPADAQRIEILVDQRVSGAYDSAFLTASYR